MEYIQAPRFIAIDTPLGKDVLLLQGFIGSEGLSQPFRLRLDLLSTDANISFDCIVGQRVTLTLKLPGNKPPRYFNGFISRFSQCHKDKRLTYYQAEMVPWLWFLSRTQDCRIFQNESVDKIITQVFEDFGFHDYDTRLDGAFAPLEYCVQYRETALDFVSRLMEEYGIFYFFEHTQSKNTLVLANASSKHPPCPGQERVRYRHEQGGLLQEGTVRSWRATQAFRSGKYTLNDYNFEAPSTNLEVGDMSSVQVSESSKYEIYDYPGRYQQRGVGERLVHIRMQEEAAHHHVIHGESDCRAFATGYRFDLVEHYRQDMNTAYVLTKVRHTATVGESYTTDSNDGQKAFYRNHFTCSPLSVPLRPPRRTRRPIVQGPQTAVVVGGANRETTVDHYGRVHVQFYWDRKGSWNEKSSCWLRVAQPWAGRNWGAMFTPRIGQEVIVDFLEGDPDCPIITGRVYNAEEMPPYDQPHVSGIKSNTTEGGGGFNELRFDDDAGREQVFIHAQRDMDLRVKNDHREWVGKNRHLVIKGSRHEEVTQDGYTKAGMRIVLEAGMELTIKASGGFMKIDPSGITIQGTMVRINSGGTPGIIPDSPQAADNSSPGVVDEVPRR